MATGFTSFPNTTDFSISHSNLMTMLQELSNLHSDTTAPTNLHDGMLWHDTANNQIKVYDLTNTAWRVLVQDITDGNCGLAKLAGPTFTAPASGSAAAGDAHFPVASQIGAMVFASVIEVTFANATHDHFVFTVPVNARYEISDVHIVSDTATSGSSAVNNWSFQVRNLTAGLDLLATAKTTNGAEIAADARYSLGVDQNNAKANLGGGDVLELQITKTGTPTDLSSAKVIVQVDYKMDLF